MDIVLDHTLGREALRDRVRARLAREAERGDAGGPVTMVSAEWRDEWTLVTEASAMGFTVPSVMTIGETSLAFSVEIPAMLGFARGMIEGFVRERGLKLIG